ncbi:class D beta-lactamase [Sphingomonas sp. HF-S3]|uniref:Beta-lactamase n=1 Tax=Sphingomonas rustica TaxID=3103142 RepID=A0ABV0B7F3_9SPHN
MMIDRRRALGALALGAGCAGLPGLARALPATAIRALVLADAASGRILHRTGAAATRFTPCSTFKVPLALMAYDAGILIDAHTPAWDYDPRIHQASRDAEKQRTDPTSYEANSVIWYSREITRRLGAARFKAYVDRIGYGNRDVSGTPGRNDGLTHSWLSSSLLVSADEQVALLRAMLARRLPISTRAQAMTEAILPVFEGSGGWTVHGKTGSGWLNGADGEPDRSTPLGWFVGWAGKGKRRLAFATFGAGSAIAQGQPGGMAMRTDLLRRIATLAG